MAKIIIVSNRLPVQINKQDGNLEIVRSIGGLATGLETVHQSEHSLWLGWCGIENEELTEQDQDVITKKLNSEYQCLPIFLSSEEVELYYNAFSNRTLWPLFHHFPMLTEYDREFWNMYRSVNRIFFNKLAGSVDDGDTVWIHDYQLLLLPQMVKDAFPETKVGFFLHIPFPSSEIFRLLPWREEILNGMLGADLIGFHTYDYVRHFLSCIRRITGYDAHLGSITVGERHVKVDAFPMGIDYDKYAGALGRADVKREMVDFKKQVRSDRVILSVDRLDYTKGIPQRVKAFGMFLERYPEWKEKVTLILIVAPSRTDVIAYMELKKELEELISQINGQYGDLGWTPILYIYRTVDFTRLTALYGLSDILLVTPLRDGMNLIVKEYIAARGDRTGVVILSETAGAASELGEAIIINPNNEDEIADSIHSALNLPEDEVQANNDIMHKRLLRYNVEHWARDFISNLEEATSRQEKYRSKKLGTKQRQNLLKNYQEAGRRLILLDYDGTLVSFKSRPELAVPDDALMTMLKKLAKSEKNDLVIISGRDNKILDEWFHTLPIHLVAGHGVWIREWGESWRLIENIKNEWKDEIRPVLEVFVHRTPGSFIEEKDYSLAWHYRKCDPDFAAIRLSELKETLLGLTGNLNIGVIDGNKVMEVKDTTINKGRAAYLWIEKTNPDCILAVGDDWTDEDMFSVMDKKAFSIKVGYGSTQANYYLKAVADVRGLLEELVGIED